MFGAAVVMRLAGLEVVDSAWAVERVRFPYVPGMLARREAPVLLEALRRLRVRPDVLLFDAHGAAHPRGFGLASHVGRLFGIPSIGCAKSRLVGQGERVGVGRGDRAWVVFEGRRVGLVLRTRAGVRPVFVSPGYRMTAARAAAIVLAAAPRWRVPEPLRAAHELAGRLRAAAEHWPATLYFAELLRRGGAVDPVSRCGV